MLLLAVAGQKSAGKGTVASVVQTWAANHGLHAEERGFADIVKQSLFRLFWPEMGRADAVALADAYKNNPDATITLHLPWSPGHAAVNVEITIRQALQREGTEIGRDLYDNYHWINLLVKNELRALKAFALPDHSLADIGIISDMRFHNEAMAVKSVGGTIWQVVRPDLVSDDNHASEVIPDLRPDLVITNTGTLEEFRERIYIACDEHLPALLEEAV